MSVPPRPPALPGRVAIATGAGRGLGRAYALALADAGARVVVNNRSPQPAHLVVDEIRSRGGEAVAHVGGVADWSNARALVELAVSTFGDLHVLVNNAGITRDRISFKMSEDEWDDVVTVNLKGHFAPARFAGACWRANGDGGGRRIVNSTSEGGLFPAQGHANYSASKAGVVGLTLELPAELGRYGVTVNAVATRARTRMTENVPMFAASGAAFDPYDPAHAAKVLTWLCSGDADDVTGQVLLVVGRRVGRVGPSTVTGRVELDHDWAAEDLARAKAKLFGGGSSGLPPHASLE